MTALAWQPDLDWLASGSVDTDVIIWRLGEDDMQLRLSGHAGAVRALCWVGGDRELLVSGSLDGTVRLWDPTTGDTVAKLDTHTGPVTAVATIEEGGGGDDSGFRPWLATGSADRSIILWDLGAARPVLIAQTPWCHALGVCALVWLPQQRWLASGSADATVKLWRLPGDIQSDGDSRLALVKTLRGHTGPVHALEAVPSRGWLASGSVDGSVRLWRVEATSSAPVLDEEVI